MRGDRLKEVRQKRGLSQRELALRCGLGEQQIWRYENGETDPAGEIIMRIAKEIEVTADYLLGIVDDPQGRLSVSDLTTAEWRLVQAYRNGDLAVLLDMARKIVPDTTPQPQE
ncbi:MAG TPA: helix-turn-helix transcriptional regulator [Aggregatilineales bacterium]|nr:helix-turn-helix transcriptional regulator [Aggregatilineales bacterium]